MPTQRLQFTEWLPDQPAIGTGLQDAKNVIPVLAGYAPFPLASDYSNAATENLNSVFVGKLGDTVKLFAGGATKLFNFDPTTLNLTNVSRVNGYGGTTRWQFTQFGNIILAANNHERVQYWNLSSSSVFQDLGSYISGTYARAATGDIAITTTNDNGLTIGNSYTFYFKTGTATDITTTIKNATITNVARTTNVVTVTTSSIHGYAIGHTVIVAATTNTSINGTFTVTGTPSTTTFTYAQTAANLASVSDTGSVYNSKAFNITNSTGITSGNLDIYTSIAPIAKAVTVVRDFVVAANVDGISNKLQWSDLNDETKWTSGAASQSDFQIIADGGSIQSITGGEIGIVFLEKAIYRMSYIGSPYFFQFDAISRNLGCIEGNSVTQFGGMSYFLSDDGFYSCDGRTITPIGVEKIDRYFYSTFNLASSDTMSTTVDPVRKLVIWNYPTVTGGRALMIYNWQLQKWTRADMDVNYVASAASTGVTLEGIGTLYPNIETVPASFDDRIWTGGKYVLAGARTTKIVTFTGANSTAEIILSDIENGYNSMINLARPLIDDGAGTVSVASRRTLADNIAFSTPVAAGEGGRVPLRSAGRFHRLKVNPTGLWTTAIAVDVNTEEQGGR